MPTPIPKPVRAEEILAAVAAARYPAGTTVTLAMIAEVGGVNEAMAGQVRRWARADIARAGRLRPPADPSRVGDMG